jgi:hypothetical protein
MKPLERRVNALKQLLNLERPTTKAKAYSEWEAPPQIILEDDEARDLYNQGDNQNEEM